MAGHSAPPPFNPDIWNVIDPLLIWDRSSAQFIVASISWTGYEAAVRERYRARLDEESERVRASIIPCRRTSLAYTRIRGRSRATT